MFLPGKHRPYTVKNRFFEGVLSALIFAVVMIAVGVVW